MHPQRALGIDVGGTKVLAAIIEVSPQGQPLVLRSEKIPVERSTPDFIAQLVDVGLRLADGQQLPVGVGIPGFVDLAGVARQAPNLPHIIDVDLVSPLRSAFGSDVVINNDANAAAAAIAATEAAGEQNVVVATLGTGIGGGLILGGDVYRGAHGFAGEIGHMIVDPAGPPCPCGQRGCWEMFASGAALGREGSAWADTTPSGSIARARSTHGVIDSPLIVSMVHDGDSEALEVFRLWSGHVAQGIVNLIQVLDPSKVILGGGIIESADVVLQNVREQVGAHRSVQRGREVSVTATTFGPEAGVAGAGLLAFGQSLKR